VIELPAIFIAGGGGLLLAKGLLFPGTLPRRASLIRGWASEGPPTPFHGESPQHRTVPSVILAHACAAPAETSAAPTPLSASCGSLPAALV
jgi:hypothetical protein